MKIVILCGGFGTRLREETEFRPKPLVDIGGKPILWHVMKLFSAHKLNDFVLCLGYRGDMIKEYFLNYETSNSDLTVDLRKSQAIVYNSRHKERFRVTMVDTGLETLTGGRIKRASKYLDGERFMVTYGDGLADVDLKQLNIFHNMHGRSATVTVTRPFSRFGLVSVDREGRATRFEEKPQIEGWTSAGFFVFEKAVLDYIQGDNSVLEKDVLPRIAAEGKLSAFKHEGFFYAMDTYREYKYLNDLWNGGNAPWKVWK